MNDSNIRDILCLGCCYKYPPKNATLEDIWKNDFCQCFKKLWNVDKCHHEMDWKQHFKRVNEKGDEND